jgi:lipoprotein-anchoring transpeptidase ErfK/SrfK
MQPLRNRWIVAVTLVLVITAFGGAQAQERKATTQRPVQNANRRIIVSIPARKLALVEEGRIVKVYPAAVGAEKSPSPAGTFRIITRIPNPTYYRPGEVIRPGVANPVGTRWLGLSLKGFGIHGTNRPRSVGRAASHGCIRLRNADVQELFDLVRVGDVVEIHAERNEDLAEIFEAPAEIPQPRPAAGPAEALD